MQEQQSLRCVILGDSSVGKTTLANNVLGYVDDSGLPQLGTCTIFKNGLNLKFEIWDTCHGELFDNVTRVACCESQICICMFDVSDDKTYDSIEDYVQTFRKLAKNKNTQVVVIANKIDKNNWAVNEQFYYLDAEEGDYDLYFTSKNSDQKDLIANICQKYQDKFCHRKPLSKTRYGCNIL
jgi:small GTP-binding protein